MEPTPLPPQPSPNDTYLRGSCLCGKVTWAATTMPIRIAICHCVECRKASGNPFLTFGLFHNDAVTWSLPDSHESSNVNGSVSGSGANAHGSGGQTLRTAAHPNIQQVAFTEMGVRGYCRTCGSPLFIKYHCRPDGINIPMGLIDNEHIRGTMPVPKEHIFLKEMAAWWTVPVGDGLARFDGFNEDFQRRLADWRSRGKPQRKDVSLSTGLSETISD